MVAVLGRGLVPPATPVLRADDLGVVRGEAVFETLHLRGGRPWLLDEHLARLAESAARMELELPDRAELVDLVTTACGAWPAQQEGALRLVCTRGPEPLPDSAPPPAAPQAFVTISPVPRGVRVARVAGITVGTATLGVPATTRADAPWLLGGVKSVSYGVNMASQRWARRLGYDDMLWTSSDGYALEGPTASLVWLDGDTLCTVPAAHTGILPGTTAAWLLRHASDLGWSAEERMVRPERLATAGGVWLLSSVRGPAPVRELDGAALTRSPQERVLRDLLGYPG